MLLHPVEEYRRFAASHLQLAGFWPVATHPEAPFLALVETLDRLLESEVSDDYRRVFVDCTFKRLLGVEASQTCVWREAC